ncbi:Alpha/Beta hydrolase protein [Desarmillaria tabescens]|uniref:Alpha/Beta hydrolase protein n=1 Tax=Armillaria tabescens TaxID=1929756 RepID=A0AA39N7B2_ARMTA|nr:Alpha/Beta hydrolase protein [Desarmillaria tabescens]KAK0460249.1 Alpha/Beta hydrolase protein [Desarmillaria tabescens]
MPFPSIVVNSSTGVELSYIDSGAPVQSSYITIFAIHGMIFTKEIFQRVIDLAPKKGVRFVALDRRPFPGSTPFSAEELGILRNAGTDDAQREAFVEARGHEVAIFIDTFIRTFGLPPISSGGGVALLGWSLGATLVSAAISSTSTLSNDICERLERHLRSVILYEPGPITLGLPAPNQYWTFLRDPSVPEDLRIPAFGQWCTSYFDHPDLSERNLDNLSWVLASSSRVPSFYNGMPASIQRYGNDAAIDLPFLVVYSKQILQAYRKTFFDSKVFPNVKRSVLCGDKTCALALAAFWAVQDDEKEQRTTDIKALEYRIIPGANHFVHWDEPEKALDVFIEFS